MERRILTALLIAFLLAPAAFAGRYVAGSPATTNNDDSCDIGLYPAATLLLAYFDVDFNSPTTKASTTLFTVTNTSPNPQIARVTMWTDFAYPGLTFNLFLTGYDVQAINMYDILARGVIAPGGTSSATTPGAMSNPNTANPGFIANPPTLSCASLPGTIPGSLLAGLQAIFTAGTAATCGTARIGGTHAHATGYLTIDVVANCDFIGPQDARYFTTELLYDNVLIGDYQQISPDVTAGNYAGGNPLVHIRAIPDGGSAGTSSNLPYTFYDRLTPRSGNRGIDRRQPLPSSFAVRYIQGGAGAFNTNFKIWREASTGSDATCSDYQKNDADDTAAITEVVRFDEHENPTTFGLTPATFPPIVTLPAASSPATSSSVFPPMSTSGDVAGWMYMNLNNGGSLQYSVVGGLNYKTGTSTTVGLRQNQNWVIVSMSAEGRYSVDFDGVSLGNGCSPAPPLSNAFNVLGPQIGPRPDGNP